MKVMPLSRFKIFESDDADESLAALSRLFGDQKVVIKRLGAISNLISVSAGSIGRLTLCHNRFAPDLIVEKQDIRDAIAFNFTLAGCMQVTTGKNGDVALPAGRGIFLPMDKSVKAVLSGYDCLSLLVPRSAIHEGLELLIGKTAIAPIDFGLVLDSQGGAGNLIRRAIELAARQFDEAHSLLDHPAVTARLEEFIIHALLYGQPHNYGEAITDQRPTATPKQVRRAEAYIHAHAGEAIRLAQIAGAAGCSIRALQVAFRTFRDTTPMAMLRQIRLARAHAELSQAGPDAMTVTEVAIKFGFSNAHRFVRDYRTLFGQSPSETLRFGSTIRPKNPAADRPVTAVMRRGD